MINQSEKAGLDEEQTNELKEAFDLFDEDGSGTLGKRELHVLLQAIGRNMDLTEIEEKIRELKQNRQTESGNDNNVQDELSQEEFILFISNLQQDTVTEELKEAYRRFSGTDDPEQGFNSKQLFRTMEDNKEKLSELECEQLFEELDVDGDGIVNFNDFVRSMMMH